MAAILLLKPAGVLNAASTHRPPVPQGIRKKTPDTLKKKWNHKKANQGRKETEGSTMKIENSEHGALRLHLITAANVVEH